MKRNNIRALCECSVMIALSLVLGLVKIAEMPYGGSVTLASMLPIAIVAYRHGLKWGMGAALANSVVQLLTGLKNFSYFTTWQSIVALALFDYIFAFCVFGLSGIFKKQMKQNLALTLGTLLASLLRYVCHVISGATIWAGLSIPDSAALLYSLGYNATYMVPETIILVACAVYLGSVVDFRRELPQRMRAESIDRGQAVLYASAGLCVLAAVITDCALIFPRLQSLTGDFIFTGLRYVNWLAVGIVTLSLFAIGAVLLLFALKREKDNKVKQA